MIELLCSRRTTRIKILVGGGGGGERGLKSVLRDPLNVSRQIGAGMQFHSTLF